MGNITTISWNSLYTEDNLQIRNGGWSDERLKRKWMGASLALASVGLLVGPQQGAEAATPKIKVHYIDVGQGDAIYIKMPSGEDIVIDGGNKGKGDELVII